MREFRHNIPVRPYFPALSVCLSASIHSSSGRANITDAVSSGRRFRKMPKPYFRTESINFIVFPGEENLRNSPALRPTILAVDVYLEAVAPVGIENIRQKSASEVTLKRTVFRRVVGFLNDPYRMRVDIVSSSQAVAPRGQVMSGAVRLPGLPSYRVEHSGVMLTATVSSVVPVHPLVCIVVGFGVRVS